MMECLHSQLFELRLSFSFRQKNHSSSVMWTRGSLFSSTALPQQLRRSSCLKISNPFTAASYAIGLPASPLLTSRVFTSSTGPAADDPFAQLMAQLQGVDTSAKKKHGNVAKPSPPPSVTEQKSAPVGTTGTIPAEGAVRSATSTTSTKPAAAPTTNENPHSAQAQPHEERGGNRFVRRGGGATSSPPSSTSSHTHSAATPTAPPVKGASAGIKSTTMIDDAASLLCGPAAYPPLTTSEMIQEGAPQHFVIEADTQSIQRPILNASGCVAMSDVVGRVATVPESFEDPSGDNGSFSSFMVEYTIPFSHTTPVKCSIEVRAYGSVLSLYAANELVVDDIVHVTGHLLPTEAGMAVVALPWGGNISVVLARSPALPTTAGA